MATVAQLEKKKVEYIKSARAALAAGDVEKGKKYRALAEKADTAIAEMNKLSGLTKSSLSSQRPPLPGTQPQKVESNGSANKAQAAYVLRFGTPDQTVKGILTDLHGNDYEAQYWQQRQAFSHYLRVGKEEMPREKVALLKQVILTPEVVKAALLKGVDSVASMKATMVEAIDTLGGFAVPVDFQTRVIEKLQGLTVMRGRASAMETSRDAVEYPVSTSTSDQYSSSVRMTWVGETPTEGDSETNLTWGSETIPVHTVMAETALSRNLVEDAAFDIEGFLTKKFAEASAIDEDNQFLVGTGIGTPQGILPGGANVLGLESVNSGASSNVAWDGLIAASFKVPTQYRQNAVWIANRSTYGTIASLKTASGYDYLWTPWQYTGGDKGLPSPLMGYDALEQECMPDEASNAYPVIFGDLSGYQIVDRIGMTVERYLDSATARKNIVIYVVRRRLGGQVVEPWRFALLKCATS